MKVLQVNCVYKKGSTGKIMYDVHTELIKNGHESIICYGRGAKTVDANVYKTCGELYSKFNNLLTRFTGIMYGGCLFSTNKLISVIKKEKPDIVHLHCLNGYFVNIYRLVSWLKKNKIKTVLTLHAEFMHTANCSHAFDCDKWKTGCGKCPRKYEETKSIFFDGTAVSWKKMKKAFEGFNDLVVTSVSPWLMNRAKQSPILADKNHVVVLNGLNTKIFYERECFDFKQKLGLEGKKIVFHATAFFSDEEKHPKGGDTIIRLANDLPDVVFIVAGPYNLSEEPPQNLIVLGSVSKQDELAKYYNIADVTVIASKRETFSMILAESLCCGTPVISYKAGGPESIALPEYSTFVEYGNYEDLKCKLENYIKADTPQIDTDKPAKTYSKEQMTANYMNVYNKLLGL